MSRVQGTSTATKGFAISIPTELIEHLAGEVAKRLEEAALEAEPYINANGAAAHLACDKRRIYDLAERGALTCYRDGKRLLFKRSDLDAYVVERRI